MDFFSFSQHGGEQQALEAAQAHRDKWARILGADVRRVRRKRKIILEKNKDLITGLQESSARTVKNGKEYFYQFIEASHPRSFRKRRFSFVDVPIRANQRTREEAVKLAVKARRAWEREGGVDALRS